MAQENFTPLKFDFTKMYINEDTPPVPRKVVCAACRLQVKPEGGPLVICGVRHWDSLMHSIIDLLEDSGANTEVAHEEGFVDTEIAHEEGFVDQYGNFLTRREAMIICKTNGQAVNFQRNGEGLDAEELYSEGLY